MLKLRLITGIALILVMVAGLVYLPTPGVALLLGVFALLSCWEWAALAGVSSRVGRAAYTGIMALVGIFLYVRVVIQGAPWFPMLMSAAVLWWLYVCAVELRNGVTPGSGITRHPLLQLFAGVFSITPGWLAPLYLHQTEGLAVLFYLFLIVWVADSAAYFAGRAWGHRKLAPSISPGKSIEGVLGGIVAVWLLTLIFVWSVLDTGPGAGPVVWLLLLASVVGLISVAGDLFESRLKRIRGVKDSGTLFPGHGGALDRTDAFYAAAPVFSLVWVALDRGGLI